MNEKFKSFVNSIGIMCETWYLAYNKFIQLGCDHKTALEHTNEFMTAFFSWTSQNGNENGGINRDV